MSNKKARSELELAMIVRLLHQALEDTKKVQDDLNALKQQNLRLIQENIEINTINSQMLRILEIEDTIKSIEAVKTELTAKENLNVESKGKEIQIRQIDKKYKDSYFDLKTNVDTRQADLAAKPMRGQAAVSNDTNAADELDVDKIIATAQNHIAKVKAFLSFRRMDDQAASPSSSSSCLYVKREPEDEHDDDSEHDDEEIQIVETTEKNKKSLFDLWDQDVSEFCLYVKLEPEDEGGKWHHAE